MSKYWEANVTYEICDGEIYISVKYISFLW